ncbi:MAG: o-succinylbenzoate synthase [Acidobacteria bacterium]|nr:MAG: o-succinylbenzoate synthase [Acidobacteriota bacterium]REJ98857.1 MAG: o-succinylbenzoate synthase [Acidobacteriota bacterium]REK16423.1 MAG: o-succinylbenzoate synthase [Acidobacteriota bacterium]REK44104.1 MAG: o-succinylbenzoate synthase [Acidobacteriota bacterium]
MKISRIELTEINLPLVHFFETSFGRTIERRIILVRVVDEEGAEGWGECTCGEVPNYSEEWTDSCWETIEKILSPLLVGKEIGSASEVWSLFSAVRGNRMSKAAIETAVWDLEAKKLDTPLWKHLGGTQEEIACGVSIGIQDSVEELLDKIHTELEAGYRRIKVKIAPGWDRDIIARIRHRFGDIPLMGDANSAYTLGDADLFKSMEEFDLMMFEQPLSRSDIVDHAKLQKELLTSICLDESIHSPEDARKAIELGSCRIVNVKLGRVGGHQQAREVETVCRGAGVPVWCGGMLESGIGRAHNIAMSTLEGFTLPGDVSASKRYWHEDIIDPEVAVSSDGYIIPPEGPGIGFKVRADRIEKLAVRETIIRD